MAETNHSERKHAEFSPSSAERWLRCPGSIALSRKAPPQIESKWAKEGTDAHECLEFLVKRFSDLKAATLDAEKKWPEEMVSHCLRTAKQIYKLRPSPDAKLLVETRVHLKQINAGAFFGTLDYAWIDEFESITVIDFKYGVGTIVETFDEELQEFNPQLMYYLAGLAHKYNYDFEVGRLVVIQPRVADHIDDATSIAECRVKHIREFEKKIQAGYKTCQQPDADLNPGKHCRYCPANTICPEISQNALRSSEIVFDVESEHMITATPEPLALNPKTLPRILRACDGLEQWIKAVREHAHALAENGTKIPGYKLVAKRPQRKWGIGAEEDAVKRYGAKVYKKKFLTPAQFEKEIRDKVFLEKYVFSESSGTNLVPEADPRSELIKLDGVFDT